MITQKLGLLRPLPLYGESSHPFYYAVLPVSTRSLNAGAYDMLLQRGMLLLLPRNQSYTKAHPFPVR